MAQATLNPAINGLDTTSTLYDLYTRFYDGMVKANRTDAPAFVTAPVYEKNEDGTYKLDEDGAKIVDVSAMATSMEEYSAILIKNSAYMFANAIVSTISPNQGGDGGTSGVGFLIRSGDTMQGMLGALYGFEAGDGNTKIFETVVDSSDNKLAIVTGSLRVSENVEVAESLSLSDKGICFGGEQVVWHEDSSLSLSSPEIDLIGDVVVDGSIKVGNVAIDKDGLSYDGYVFYHSGNSNKDDVDWTMRDAYIKRDLQVVGSSTIEGVFVSSGGFLFSIDNNSLLYSISGKNTSPYVELNSDLSIVNNHGIKCNGNHIVWVRNGNIVSFSAPGSVMNLGDSGTDGDGSSVATKHIALQADIKSYNGAYTMITHDGNANFPNGFSTGAANAVGATFRTYYTGNNDYGVVSMSNMRFGSEEGPSFSSDSTKLNISLPFSYTLGGILYNASAAFTWCIKTSDSIVYNPTFARAKSSLFLDTDATHFAFGAPIEAEKFSIKSSRYKTQLAENVLFFDDRTFIEGLEDGMRLSQNSMFDGNLYSFNSETSSISFSSGFAGSGWAIMEDSLVGGTHATFDSLTIRKKMRVYEFEVQKISTANGALWVSDSCSGDEVVKLN